MSNIQWTPPIHTCLCHLRHVRLNLSMFSLIANLMHTALSPASVMQAAVMSSRQVYLIDPEFHNKKEKIRCHQPLFRILLVLLSGKTTLNKILTIAEHFYILAEL